MANTPVYISSSDSIRVTDPYVIFYQLTPKSISWDNTAQSSYYIVNSTGNDIPFSDGTFYYDANSVLANKIVAGASLYIVKNNLNNWLQVTAPGDITTVTGGGDATSIELPIATSNRLGGVKIGSNLAITTDGTLSAIIPSGGVVGWNDITGKPTFSAVALTGAYSDLLGKPTLSAVATSGSYTDLINKPVIPTYAAGTNITITGSSPNFTINSTGGGSPITLTTTGTSGVATLISNVLNVPNYTYTPPAPFISSITTTGSSGPATVIGGVLNVPQYSGTSYTLPTATTSVLGGVKVDGTSITIDGSGVIHAPTASTITLTTIGTSGAASLVGTTLNVPNYTSGSTLPTSMPLASQVGILANGSDQTSALNAIFGSALYAGIVMDFSNPAAVTITGTVNAQGKTIRFNPGSTFTGAGTILSAVIDAGYWQKCFDITVSLSGCATANDMFSVRWYGATGNNSTNDQPALQKSSDTVIANTGMTRDLYVPPGSYRINAPWILYNWNGTQYSQFLINVKGNIKTANSNVQGVARIITQGISQTFAIGVQRATSGSITGLSIEGLFTFSIASYETFVNTTFNSYNGGAARDSRYSPYSGIVIDPFCNTTSLPADGGYPGYDTWYRGTGSNGGTTDFLISDCTVHGFVVDIMNTPNGQTQQGEDCIIQNCRLETANVAVAYGQTQSDNCYINNCRSWDMIWTVVDTFQYGNGQGYAASIDGYNVAGKVNTLFNISTNKGVHVKNFYAESFFTIGRFQCVFSGGSLSGTFHFGNSVMTPQYHLWATNIQVNCDSIRYYDDQFNKRIRLYQPRNVQFNNVFFDLPPYEIFESQNQSSSITFRNCRVGPAGILGATNDQFYYEAPVNYFIPYGRFKVQTTVGQDVGLPVNPTITYTYDNTTFNRSPGTVASGVTITPDGSRSATFTTSIPASVRPDDIIIENSTGNVIGRVSTIVGSTVTLAEIPTNIVAGTYTVSSVYFLQGLNNCVGDITNASANITNAYLMNPGYLNTLAVGFRFDHGAFPRGTYITNYNSGTNTITLSNTANKTAIRQNFLNGNPEVTVQAIEAPNSAYITTYASMIPTGATWTEMINAVSTGGYLPAVWKFFKGGFVNAAALGASAAFQADFGLVPPMRFDGSNLLYFNNNTSTWNCPTCISTTTTTTTT